MRNSSTWRIMYPIARSAIFGRKFDPTYDVDATAKANFNSLLDALNSDLPVEIDECLSKM